MVSATLLAPSGPAARLSLIMDGLRRALAARMAKHRAAAPLLLLAWAYLGRAAARFARLAARAGAGPRAPRRTTARRPPDPAPLPRPGQSLRQHLPGGFAWLVRLVPEAASSGSQLQHLLATDPDIAALLQAAPQAGRILRPLCRMLAVRPVPPVAAAPPRPAGPEPSRPDGPAAASSPAIPPRRGALRPPRRDKPAWPAGLPPPATA